MEGRNPSNIYAIIDVGSHNILVLIAKKKQQSFNILKRMSFTSELAKGMVSKCLSAESIEKTKKIIKESYQFSLVHTENIIIIGTSCSRDARNIQILANWIEKVLKCKFNIISGDKEAYLNGIANIDEFPQFSEIILFDVGGGSAEFTLIRNKKIISTESIDLGIRRLFNKFPNCLEKRIYFTRNILKKIDLKNFENPVFIGIGGIVTNLSAANQNLKEYNSEKVHKCILKKEDIYDLYQRFQKVDGEEITEIVPFEPSGAEIIQTGTMIIKEIVDHFQTDKIYVSDRGLQFGVLKLKQSELRKML